MKLKPMCLLMAAILLTELAQAETYYHAHLVSKNALQNVLETNSEAAESLEAPGFSELNSLKEKQNLYELVYEFNLPDRLNPPSSQETYSQHLNKHMQSSPIIAESEVLQK